MKPISPEDILEKAWRCPFTTRSDFARERAEEIAAMACQGLITTRVMGGLYSNLWCITEDGLTTLDAYPLEGRSLHEPT